MFALALALAVAIPCGPVADAQELPSCCAGTACCGGPGGPTACELRYGASGTVVDARSGDPIVGARVVLNGSPTVTLTDADGHYGIFLSREDTCHLDYLVDVSITADGYAPFRDTLYTSVPLRQVDARLAPLDGGPGVTIDGVVAETFPCAGGADGVTVILEPFGLQVVAGTTPGQPAGYFEFTNLPPGEYTLRTDPACNVHGCWEPQPVSVSSTDVTASLCPMVRRNAVQLAVGQPVGEPGGSATVEVTISDASSAGGDPTSIRATIGFGTAASIASGGDGSPACVPAAARSGTFAWSPDGCTPGTDCTALVADLDTASVGLPNGAALFRCQVAITDQPAETCFHEVRCLAVTVRRDDGRELASACTNGWVESRFPVPPLSYAFSVTPEQPEIGDQVRVEVTVAGAGGLPSFQLDGARPQFAGNTTVNEGGPVSGTVGFDLTAVQQGIASLVLRVSYETELGCPGQSHFGFVRDQSEPYLVEVEIGDATPIPTPTPIPSPDLPCPTATQPLCPTGQSPQCSAPVGDQCGGCICQACPACPSGEVFTGDVNSCACRVDTAAPENPDTTGGSGGGSCSIERPPQLGGTAGLGIGLLALAALARRRRCAPSPCT